MSHACIYFPKNVDLIWINKYIYTFLIAFKVCNAFYIMLFFSQGILKSS